MSHPIPNPKYDVFLSFRGEDTRQKFTSHVYARLKGENINTFIDEKLERGDEISPSLIEAIEGSFIYVVILSKHYASSHWCLDELIKILEYKKEYGREVIPVFYEVDPTDVRHQTGSYGQDFLKHHQHRPKDKIDAWKVALTHVGKLSGLVSQNFSPESTLVEMIAKDILKKLNHPISGYNNDGMIGMDRHIKQLQSLLLLESQTVRMIGIWGMGGIGKTTIAKAIFEKLTTQFSSRSIIIDVQEEIKRHGLSAVKSKYLSQLLEKNNTSIESNFSIVPSRLKWTKSLIVFDDVKESKQLEYLIGTHENFGPGSRIIVTSRDKKVLENANADEIYPVSEMDDHDSLQLFCLFAFKQNHPEESFVSLTEKVLDYAKGLPLALNVLGSFLKGKTKQAWESELQTLKKHLNGDIFDVLKLCYDGLDDFQKDIFLDIACFHRGELEKFVEQTLNCYYGLSTRTRMNALEDRCLISISKGRVWMHDLIREMGHKIVRDQWKYPERRSRLWNFNDIYDVFGKNKGKGTDVIECIFLDMEKIKEVKLHAKTFKKMCNLRIIKFNNNYYGFGDPSVTFHTFLESLPNALKILHWTGFPQKYLPQDFRPENLVTLNMSYSYLEQLWEEEDQALPNLKRLNLSHSEKLIRLPDLSLCPNIEEVILRPRLARLIFLFFSSP